jgi:hypothetical protein
MHRQATDLSRFMSMRTHHDSGRDRCHKNRKALT